MVVIHRSKRSVRHPHDATDPAVSEAPSPNQPPMFLALEDLKRGVLPHNATLSRPACLMHKSSWGVVGEITGFAIFHLSVMPAQVVEEAAYG